MEQINNINRQEITTLLTRLEKRFEQNKNRHLNMDWALVLAKLETQTDKLWALLQMENTGGEPDVVVFDEQSTSIIFVDCSPESPKDRRSFCYDLEALESRKDYPPKNNVIDMTKTMGIELLDENDYFRLQELGPFDCKTSSWLKTPKDVRKLGGAIFGDFRFGRVFIYHNGAFSYYAARGFRGKLRIS